MDNESLFLIAGVIAGGIIVGIIWLVVSGLQRKARAVAEKERRSVTTTIGQLVATVDNHMSEFRIGTEDSAMMRKNVSLALEQINSRIKANISLLETYYVKYMEHYVEDQWQILLKTSQGSVPVILNAVQPDIAETSIKIESDGDSIKQEPFQDMGDRITTVIPAIPHPMSTPEIFQPEEAVLQAIPSEPAPLAEELPIEEPSAAPEVIALPDTSSAIVQPISPVAEVQSEPEPIVLQAPEQSAPIVIHEEVSIEKKDEPAQISNVFKPIVEEMPEPVIVPEPVLPSIPVSAPIAQVSPEEDADSFVDESEPFDDVISDRTQIFDINALKAKARAAEKNMNAVPVSDTPILSTQDARIGQDFMFGGASKQGESRLPPLPSIPELEQIPVLPVPPQPVPVVKSEPAKKAGGHHDDLITGDDVMSQMDSFFGFDK